MSHWDVAVTAGSLPPQVPTSFTTDVRDNSLTPTGTAIPSASVLQILGRDTNQDNDNGIRTDADPNNGNIVYVELTNRQTAQITTTDATPTILISLSLGAVPGVYYVTGNLTAYDLTDVAGAAYSFSGAARTTGGAAVEISTEFKDVFEEVAMTAADFNIGVTANTAFLQVQGIAGKTINWNAELTYRFVS